MKNLQKTLAVFTLTFCIVLSLCLQVSIAATADDETSAAQPGDSTARPGSLGFWDNVKSKEDFAGWQDAVLAFHRKTLGIKPDYQPLPLHTAYTESKKITDSVTRHRIEYSTTDGLRIPAYLFVPKTDKPVPVVIVYHGHGAGKTNAAEGEGTNENALAKYIAEKLGYVVLAPDSRSFGEFKIPHSKDHIDYYFSLFSKNKLYMSKLMEDGFQDMALLGTIPQADMSRLGVAGISMGSWRSFNFAAMHPEARATVISGLFIPWDYLFSAKHCRCQHIPKLAKRIAAEDLAAAIFPRDILIQWGLNDSFHEMGAEPLIDRTSNIAAFLGYSDHLTVDRHPGMGHMFSDPEIADFFHARFGDGAWAYKKDN